MDGQSDKSPCLDLTSYFLIMFYLRVWEREANMNQSMVIQRQNVRYWNYREDYWPCAGVPTAVNVIGTQLRDPMNSGLTRWCMAVFNK